jgi:cyclophilin family peptidyl-prolyl cis-trans isomerase
MWHHVTRAAIIGSMLLGIAACSQTVPDTQKISTEPTAGQPPNPRVLLETSKGNITLELFRRNAPLSVANFLSYVQAGYYDGTIFHRVIPGFMIQGGGLTPNLSEKPSHAPVRNEANNGLKNLRGSLAMARLGDPHSGTSQFFINVANNDNLNHRDESTQGWGYAVFGKVASGMEVVDAIVMVPRDARGPYQDVPNEPVLIRHVRLME